jgi:hypothetical protein
MPVSRNRCHLGVVALVLAVVGPSQTPAALQAVGPDLAISKTACGVFHVGDVPWAHGADYKAELAAGGVTFVPALGRRSPRTRSLRLELASVGRRGEVPVSAPVIAPHVAGDVVEYQHDGCRERYEVLAAGLAQSFVFDELPRGEGDLVVSLRAHTDLPLHTADAQHLQFVDPQHGGVAMRGVFGIDAAGRRVAGAMRCVPAPERGSEHFTIELSLPAAFVANTALPLVLDPLLGTVFVPGGGPDDSYFDVAYEPTTDRYLVVWDRSASLLNIDLVGQRLDGNGASVGSLLTIRAGVLGLSRNRVVAVDARDAFVVAWWNGGVQTDIAVAAVNASIGSVGPELVIGSAAGNDNTPDLGVASDQDDAAILVWTAPGTTVRGTRVTVDAAGTLTAGAIVDVSPVGLGRNPQICHGAANGRLLVGWFHSSLQRVDGAVIDANLQVLATPALVPVTSFPMNFAVDGDGDRWLCAWEVGNGLTTGNLFARAIEWQPATSTAAVGAVAPVATSTVFAEKFPSVGWLGNAAAIGFVSADFVSPTYVTTTALTTLDPVACTPCEAAATAISLPQGFGHFDTSVAVRPRPAGTASEVLFVWNEDDPAAGVIVRAQRFRSDDGLENDRGGACGGGDARHTCARTGNGDYQLLLTGAPAGQPTLLLLGTAALQLGCGPCTIGPDPATGAAVFVGVTSPNGTAAQALPLPPQSALVGFTFLEQWLTLAPGGGCVGFAASNTLEVQLQ